MNQELELRMYGLVPYNISPIQQAILHGDSVSGISYFKLDEGMDTGPVYSRSIIKLTGEESTLQLLGSMSRIAAEEILRVVSKIESGAIPENQETTGITLAPKINKEVGFLSGKNSVVELKRKIRALGENPGCFLKYQSTTLKILELADYKFTGEIKPGFLQSTKSALVFHAKDGVVAIERLKPEGKKEMSGADFGRGARLDDGVMCEY